MELISQFEKFNESHPAPQLKEQRRSAMNQCARLGWPSRKDESWKYTSLKSLREIEWTPSNLAPQRPAPEILRRVFELIKQEHCNLVFVNGLFNSALSSPLPEGAEWKGLAEFPDLDKENVFANLQGVYFS